MNTANKPLIKIEEMKLENLDRVMEIEKASFPTPWSRDSFVSEILHNKFACYYVLLQNFYVVGYAGMWIVNDESHITTLAVDPDYRKQKLATLLLDKLITKALAKGVDRMTLEVRPSNNAAQALYRKHGFRQLGIRKNYYIDTGEDAVVMWKSLRG